MGFFDRSITMSATPAASLTGSVSTSVPGEMLLLDVTYGSTTALSTPPTIGGNAMTFVPGAGVTTGSTRQEVWSYIAPTALSSAAVVVTLPSSVNASAILAAFDGPTSITAKVIQAYAGSGGTTGSVNVAITTPDAYDYLVAFYGSPSGPGLGAGTGFTTITNASSGGTIVSGIYATAATTTASATNAVFSVTPGVPAGNFIALALRTGPLMASVGGTGTTGTITWATASGGVSQASGFGTTQGLSGTASGGAFTISGVSTTGLVTTFTTSRALGAGETGTISTAAGAFTDNSSSANPCPAGTVAFTITGSAPPRNLTVGVVY